MSGIIGGEEVEGIEERQGGAFYLTTLDATAEQYSIWLTSLHEAIPPPGETLRISSFPFQPSFPIWEQDSDLVTRLGLTLSSLPHPKQEDSPFYVFGFATADAGPGTSSVFTACYLPGLPFVLNHWVELVFHSIFRFATDPLQVSRVHLWRYGVEVLLPHLLRGRGKRVLKPYQRKAVEEWQKLVDAGAAPLQEVFARRYGVTARSLRYWRDRYKGDA